MTSTPSTPTADTAPTPASPSPLATAAAEDAVTDLARTDSTNTTLAGLSGVLLTVMAAGAGLTSTDDAYPVAAQLAMGAAAAILAGVLVVLAVAMWPRSSAAPGVTGGVPHYARRTAAELAAELAGADPDHWQTERATTKARIAARKHRCQRIAGGGLAVAGVLLALATVLTLI